MWNYLKQWIVNFLFLGDVLHFGDEKVSICIVVFDRMCWIM